MESADEILAEYSVPAYLNDPKEISQLIKNIDALLAEGGTARIWPLQVGKKGEESERFARRDALIDGIREINKTKKYEIILDESAGRSGTIKLHKLAPTKAEIQKSIDQEEIEKIRASIGLK